METKTERQAWLYLARLWDKPNRDVNGRHFIFEQHYFVFGLCNSIFRMRNMGAIDSDTWRSMARRIPGRGIDMQWSLSKRGAAARARFCRKQADKLRKRK